MSLHNKPYQTLQISSDRLIVPRNTYQRGLNPERTARIASSFDERIANEPKVSYRDRHYYVFDGQHILAARVMNNGGNPLPVLCKVYKGLSDKEEALLFANQTGYSAPPSIGMKLRALVFAEEPEACSFLKVTEEAGFHIDYGQHKGRNTIACISAGLVEFRKLGKEKYLDVLKILKESWDGDPDSLRAETLTAVSRFVDLYAGEYDRKRLVRRLRGVDPMKIYREGRAMGDAMSGYRKYLFQVFKIYNGASVKSALPMKF